jgi:hypothetical protein
MVFPSFIPRIEKYEYMRISHCKKLTFQAMGGWCGTGLPFPETGLMPEKGLELFNKMCLSQNTHIQRQALTNQPAC